MLLLLTVLANAVANVSMKLGMADKSASVEGGVVSTLTAILLSPAVLLGFMFFGGAFVLYSAVLSRMDLSLAYPVMFGGVSFIVLVVGVCFLGEPVTFLRVLGMGTIAFGIALVSRSG
jgi:multidrug transporter EmrE-like cation transporter